ncbi:MAG: aminotransferase class V-fold PLP-dependent enzyme, partial [Phycisphaerae bacterium]|nr:aminotransferase class V-fold PLP-dependent enzyme [Saprospiraceae bacterium]
MKHSTLQLVTALWLAAAHFALAQTATIGKPPVDNPLSVINFGPATLPLQNMNNPSTYIPEAQSAALLDSLLPYVKGVRTFETQKGLELVPKLAKDRGLCVRTVKMIPGTGRLDMDDFGRLINGRTKLVAIGAASNALGTINDVRIATDIAHEAGALVLVDAVHYAPHCLPDVRAIGCDFLVCSAYKFYGPHIGI